VCGVVVVTLAVKAELGSVGDSELVVGVDGVVELGVVSLRLDGNGEDVHSVMHVSRRLRKGSRFGSGRRRWVSRAWGSLRSH
jgi:hypothetical protein